MVHLLKAIQRLRRRTGLGDSLAVHRRNNVLRSSKPKARRRYFVCAKGMRNGLNSMVRKGVFLIQPTPSPSGGMEQYMQGERKARSKGEKNAAERKHGATRDDCTHIWTIPNTPMVV